MITQQGMAELSLSLPLFLLLLSGPPRPPFPNGYAQGSSPPFPTPTPTPEWGTVWLPRSARHLGKEAGFVAASAAVAV